MTEVSQTPATEKVTKSACAESAVGDGWSHVRLWFCAVVGLAADLWSKHWAFTSLGVGETRTIVPGFLDLQLSLNPGALFGMGAGMAVLFIVASIIALGFVLYLFAGTSRKHRAIHLALGMILAGALGNLYDRAFTQYDMVEVKATDGRPAWSVIGELEGDSEGDVITVRPWISPEDPVVLSRDMIDGEVVRIGVVRDFLKFTTKVGERDVWPWIFNVADVLLVVGVALLMLSYISVARQMKEQEAAAEADGATE